MLVLLSWSWVSVGRMKTPPTQCKWVRRNPNAQFKQKQIKFISRSRVWMILIVHYIFTQKPMSWEMKCIEIRFSFGWMEEVYERVNQREIIRISNAHYTRFEMWFTVNSLIDFIINLIWIWYNLVELTVVYSPHKRRERMSQVTFMLLDSFNWTDGSLWLAICCLVLHFVTAVCQPSLCASVYPQIKRICTFYFNAKLWMIF